MWQEAETEIARELRPDENLAWSGRPRQGVFLRSSDLFLIPFSLTWGGFAIWWEVMVVTAFANAEDAPGGIDIVFFLFGLPFVLAGLYLIFGRFLVAARRRAKTFYGLTGSRVIIVSGLFRRKVRSLSLRTLTDVSLTENSGGRGTIFFGRTYPMAWFAGSEWPGADLSAAPCFDQIEEGRKVYDMILKVQGQITLAENGRI